MMYCDIRNKEKQNNDYCNMSTLLLFPYVSLELQKLEILHSVVITDKGPQSESRSAFLPWYDLMNH